MALRISHDVGCGFSIRSALQDKIMPGVQKPHWMAPFRTKASWSRSRSPDGASPSIVRISVPSICPVNTVQEVTAFPSRITVHAPHSPSEHPSFTLVIPRSLRRKSISLFVGETFRVIEVPLILKEISMTFPSGRVIARLQRPSTGLPKRSGDEPFRYRRSGVCRSRRMRWIGEPRHGRPLRLR